MSDDAASPRRYVLRRAAPARSYRVDYARELNEEQKAVVFASDGPTLVVAGAGSGKTRTLVYRVSRLIEDGADPASLLLLTFTNRAAREMKRRVEALIGADLNRATAGTFHSSTRKTRRTSWSRRRPISAFPSPSNASRRATFSGPSCRCA
jgi:predicted RNase H-like nuclease